MNSNLPIEYRWLRAHGLSGLTPWWFIDQSEEVHALQSGYERETDDDSGWLPFMRRQDCDDVAGFVVDKSKVTPQVVVVHLTWSGAIEPKGYPLKQGPLSFSEFMAQVVVPDSQEWMSEVELADITA